MRRVPFSRIRLHPGFSAVGDGLRFHSDEVRATEVTTAVQVLNRMLDRPNSVRVA